MKKYSLYLGLLTVLLCCESAFAHIRMRLSLSTLIKQSEVVGIVKITGVRTGLPPMLEAEVHHVYKGGSTFESDDASQCILIDLTGTTSSWNLLARSGSGLAKYQRDPLRLAFLKQSSGPFLEGKRVMTPIYHTYDAMTSINNHLNTTSTQLSLLAQNYLFAVELLVELDALSNREQKIAFLKHLKAADSTRQNPYLSREVESWLYGFERETAQEKPSQTPAERIE